MGNKNEADEKINYLRDRKPGGGRAVAESCDGGSTVEGQRDRERRVRGGGVMHGTGEMSHTARLLAKIWDLPIWHVNNY